MRTVTQCVLSSLIGFFLLSIFIYIFILELACSLLLRNVAIMTLSSSSLLLFLVGLRLVNALSIRTFFQPDEFFQSLEPAWQLAFGKDGGAWITWVSFEVEIS